MILGGATLNHLSKHELDALLEAAKVNPRDYVMIHTAYMHGLRASEVVGLTTHNVRDGFVILQRLKGSLKTVQPASKVLLDFVSNLEAGAKIFGLTRRQFQRIVHKYGRLAGIAEHKCHPHVLKHSIAMHTIRDAGIENVRQYLGHRSLASTGAYLRVSDETASQAVAAALAGESSI